MSITAFPVLARILEERGLGQDDAVGTTAIACAAVDDVTAWCVLAVVVAIVRAGDLGATRADDRPRGGVRRSRCGSW